MPPDKESGVKVSTWRSAFDNSAPSNVDLAGILESIRSGKWERQTARARELFEAWRAVNPHLDDKTSPAAKAYDAHKRTLPAFMVSGTATERKKEFIADHSGYLQIDLDKLNGTLESVRDMVRDDPHVAFGFLSPSGAGLKLGLRIDGKRHLESFTAAEAYFRENYGIEIDRAVKDPTRLCFVSHDPDLWTTDGARPLPIPEAAPPAANTAPSTNAAPGVLLLPSGGVTISESARAIFTKLAPAHTLFFRGGQLVELMDLGGVSSLEIVKPDAFRSRAERAGMLMAWRSGANGDPVLKPGKMSRDDAAAILASLEAREILPPIASVLRCPVLVEGEDGEPVVLGRGYHPEQGGLLIVDGEAPPGVPVGEAARSLRWLIEEVDFQSEGDRSRALAAFITPALRMGGHLPGNVPIDVAEADRSQAGKGYRQSLVCALYGESAYFVTSRNGGVGSVDESFAAALVAGRPFISLDNFRGKLDSQTLESFMTCPGLFGARVPHRGEVLVDPSRFMLQMSSNGLEATRDLVNRASICRIRKKTGFAYRDTVGELKARQSYFLGCVFSIISEWIDQGKPRSKETRHDFREWCQTLDWIVQRILESAPLMEGHTAAQERASNPALAWLRNVALALKGENRMGESLMAGEIAEISNLHGLEIPGLKNGADEDHAKRQVGILMRRVFSETDVVDVDDFQVERAIRRQSRADGGGEHEVKNYVFAQNRTSAQAAQDI